MQLLICGHKLQFILEAQGNNVSFWSGAFVVYTCALVTYNAASTNAHECIHLYLCVYAYTTHLGRAHTNQCLYLIHVQLQAQTNC